MAVTFELNGFPLDKKDFCKVMEGTEYSSALSMRRVNLESPGLHGQIPMWFDPLDTLKIALRLRVLKPRLSPLWSLFGTGTACESGRWSNWRP